jgi:hypothetical protein
MMTADFISGRLDWNSNVISEEYVREAKGKGKSKDSTKKEKKAKGVDVSGLQEMPNSKVEDLDNLVASMEARDVLPPTGTGLKESAKTRKPSEQDSIIDRISAKYGIKPKKRAPPKRKS